MATIKDRRTNMATSSMNAQPAKGGAGAYSWGSPTSVTNYAPVGTGYQSVQTGVVVQQPTAVVAPTQSYRYSATSFPALGATTSFAAAPAATQTYAAPPQTYAAPPTTQIYAAAPATQTYAAAPATQAYAAAPATATYATAAASYPTSSITMSAPMTITQPAAPTMAAAPVMAAAPAAAVCAPAAVPWRVKLGAEMPNFFCETTHGDFNFHDFIDSNPDCPWTVLFSHPKDYTPVCTTEIGRCEVLTGEFQRRGVKLIGVSCDPVDEHIGWSRDILYREQIAKPAGEEFLNFPIIADSSKEIVVLLGMLDPDEIDNAGLPLPARALILIGPDRKVKLSILYPATTGRNFDEILRTIDSVQLTAGQGLATPVDWRQGDRCIVAPSVTTDDAKQRFANFQIEELPSGKQYLRSVDCPPIG